MFFLPLLGAALKIGSGLIAANRTRRENERTREYNSKEAREAEKREWAYKNREYEKVWRREDQIMSRNSASALRKQYEDAGFNPMALMGSGVGVQGQPSAVGGVAGQFAPSAFTGAAQGQLIADGLTGAVDTMMGAYNARQQLELQKAELDMKHQALADLSKKVALNPSVPGIYGGRNERSGIADDGANNRRGGRTSGSPYPQEPEVRTPPDRDQYNLYVDVYDSQTGRWITIPNPDLMDVGPVEAAHSLSVMGAADLLQNGLGLGGAGAIRKPQSAKKKARLSDTPAYQQHMKDHYPTVYD